MLLDEEERGRGAGQVQAPPPPVALPPVAPPPYEDDPAEFNWILPTGEWIALTQNFVSATPKS
jgi:hypothetical protein